MWNHSFSKSPGTVSKPLSETWLFLRRGDSSRDGPSVRVKTNVNPLEPSSLRMRQWPFPAAGRAPTTGPTAKADDILVAGSHGGRTGAWVEPRASHGAAGQPIPARSLATAPPPAPLSGPRERVEGRAVGGGGSESGESGRRGTRAGGAVEARG